MLTDLQQFIFTTATQLRIAITGAQRDAETNKEWGAYLKGLVRNIIDVRMKNLSRDIGADVLTVDMPYTAETGSGRGTGQNLLVTKDPSGKNSTDGEKIYCLIDEIDGTWNANCGLPFSCSTTMSFTKPTRMKPEELTLAHFYAGFIIPYFGAGMYFNEYFNIPKIAFWDGQISELHMSPVVSPGQTRVIIDLFTEEKKDSLALSIPVIGPVIYDWCDFGRLYGAGVEVTALFGYKNMTPGFSAYVAANQKTDNIAPMYSLIFGAGGNVTDWWGESVMNKKLLDRVHVVMSANEELHENLIGHLSKRPINEEK